MMKIDQLPTEVLTKIFSYLQSYGDVSLVNRRFYDVACGVHDSVSFSFISLMENGNHRSVMDSVQNTRRKISTLSIDFGDSPHLAPESAISDIVAIVKNFSATIKRFELREVLMEMSDFLEMLSWLPNAEYLMFHKVYKKRSPTGCQLSNECLNLHRLNTLELRGCSQEFLVVFNRLPACALKILNISHGWNLNLNLLAGLITQQSNVKELVLAGIDEGTLQEHIFDHLKLESLELHLRLEKYNSSHATILSRQTKLIHLRLSLGEEDDQILNVISNQLSELETLDINVYTTQVVAFRRIEKLKKLKELTLKTSSLKVIETLAGLDNSRITTLDLKETYTREIMPVDVIATLANSLPNLKVLLFDFDYYEYQTVAAVMQNFNFLEVLEMRFDYDIDVNGLCQTIEVGSWFNPKLTELKIEKFPCDESFLTKLASVYPNLKKLDIRQTTRSTYMTPSLFKAMLSEFKKMESLSLKFYRWPFSTEYLECIKEHKNHLKSITLGRLGRFDSEYEFTAEHRQKLGAVFDVLKYEDRTLHLADTKSRL